MSEKKNLEPNLQRLKSRPCPECGQPVLPDGQMRPHPDWYRHAEGCPMDDWPKNQPNPPTEEKGQQ